MSVVLVSMGAVCTYGFSLQCKARWFHVDVDATWHRGI